MIRRAALCVLLVACGARSDIVDEDDAEIGDASNDTTTHEDGSGLDAGKKDSSFDVIAIDVQGLCCLNNQCVTCDAGTSCVKGSCIADIECSSSTCAGCCWDPKHCADGTEQHACGHAGSLCQSCILDGDPECVALPDGGGVCKDGQTCGPGNCPSGCCVGNVCSMGNTTAQCGADGEKCAACKSGESCVPYSPTSGSCQSGPFCTYKNCKTCCKGNQCMKGDTDDACGTNSDICHDCTAEGKICADGYQCVAGDR